jgi:hypothetical protein
MTRTNRALRFAVLCAGLVTLFALVATTASARPRPQTAPGDPLDPRTYAPESQLSLVLHAEGVQNYTCQANGAWLFTDPEALLSNATGRSRPIGAHFLNFATGRPVWQFVDGSSVEAARWASAPAGEGNIASLLLQAVTTTAGSDGERLAGTTWVQRLNTSGGIAPAGACTPTDQVAVPYSADYLFWRAADEDGSAD